MSEGDPNDVFAAFRGVFDDLFATRRLGKDLALTLSISLVDADRGTTRRVEVDRGTLCASCKGLGGGVGATRSPCASCDGKGQRDEVVGDLRIARTCSDCGGRGARWDRPCTACSGQGEQREKKALDVTIPAGVASGSVLRLRGHGNDLGEGAGDLHVTIDVAPHATLVREADHLRARVRFDAARAVRGGTLVVPWLDGSARVPMPAQARAGEVLQLPGWGTTKFGTPYAPPSADGAPYRSAASTRGDLLVTLVDDRSLAEHYRVLGVHLGASPTEIKAAYRRLAIALHPERHPENAAAPEAFARLNAAYAAITGVTSPDGATEPSGTSTTDTRQVAIVAAVIAVASAIAWFVLR